MNPYRYQTYDVRLQTARYRLARERRRRIGWQIACLVVAAVDVATSVYCWAHGL